MICMCAPLCVGTRSHVHQPIHCVSWRTEAVVHMHTQTSGQLLPTGQASDGNGGGCFGSSFCLGGMKGKEEKEKNSSRDRVGLPGSGEGPDWGWECQQRSRARLGWAELSWVLPPPPNPLHFLHFPFFPLSSQSTLLCPLTHTPLSLIHTCRHPLCSATSLFPFLCDPSPMPSFTLLSSLLISVSFYASDSSLLARTHL